MALCIPYTAYIAYDTYKISSSFTSFLYQQMNWKLQRSKAEAMNRLYAGNESRSASEAGKH